MGFLPPQVKCLMGYEKKAVKMIVIEFVQVQMLRNVLNNHYSGIIFLL